jgi:hypothetical protein
MAITSLNNYSVKPAAGVANQGLLMPKLKYRFRVVLLGFGVEASTELTKQVQDVTRPTVSFEEMTLDVYNSKVKLAGRYSWENITLTLRDDANGNVTKLVGQQVQKQFDFMEQASARSGIDYKFTTRIEILDGGNGNLEPQVLETFELYGCYVNSAAYGELGYGTNEHATVALTIAYDNAIHSAGTVGIGTNVGRQVATELTTGSTPPFTA